ncbi:MAG: hypothetical protein E6Q40_12665 [Cupriavidus sp.]|nr:MAG: hypothetical protein E6Q40_12665 [Cupriavidus sp.]
MLEITANETTANEVQSFAGVALDSSLGRDQSDETCRAEPGEPARPTSRRDLYTTAQITSWRKFNDSVRSKGGRMFVQLWHVDSDVSLCPEADADILVDEVRHAAAQAAEAGFDGVELHVGNGLRLEQYLKAAEGQPGAADDSALSLRARLLLDVVTAVTQTFGADRTRVCATSLPSGGSHVRHSFVVGRLGVAYRREVGDCKLNPTRDDAHLDASSLPAAPKHAARANPKGPRRRAVFSGAQERHQLPA